MRVKAVRLIVGMVLLLGFTSLLLFGINTLRREAIWQESAAFNWAVPTGGNSWVVNHIEENRKVITDKGITRWCSSADTLNIFFHTDQTGELHLGIRARVLSGRSAISVAHGSTSHRITLDHTGFDTVYAGNYFVHTPGYQRVQLVGIQKQSDEFAEISDLLIGGVSTTGRVRFVRDDFYWGKRGPSVHLSYLLPEDAGQVKWFFNEVTVPEGEDVLGSYFMACGFSHGYFGIQVNSDTERRVLFSVWSPFRTDNPDEIPEDKRVVMAQKGPQVYTGEFGNEGSGGQSYLKYNWKAGMTYGFLLSAEPQSNGHTAFTAWFHAPETGEWQLIAKFIRPDLDPSLTRLYSFVENFYTETGVLPRRAFFSNQWVCDAGGHWSELTSARFTADATARKGARLDYSGGAAGDRFFLANCGFTNHHTSIDKVFIREPTGQPPEIVFSALPVK
ncbi:MAG: DUF3472 domain-containing protein [Bacteroidota bacterium]